VREKAHARARARESVYFVCLCKRETVTERVCERVSVCEPQR